MSLISTTILSYITFFDWIYLSSVIQKDSSFLIRLYFYVVILVPFKINGHHVKSGYFYIPKFEFFDTRLVLYIKKEFMRDLGHKSELKREVHFE